MKNILTIILTTVLITMNQAIRSEPVTTPVAENRIPVIQERVEVLLKDLPEKVRTSVGHGTPTGWTILKAYLVTLQDQSQYYDLYVQKMDEETWMKVDKNGQVLN